MHSIIVFFLGTVFGGVLGVIVMALAVAAGRRDGVDTFSGE